MQTKKTYETVTGDFTVSANYGGERRVKSARVLSFADYGEALDLVRPHAGNPNSNYSHESTDKKWSGSASYEEADALAVNGWPKGAAMADKLRANLCGVMGSRSLRPKLWRDVSGFAPCVPAAIAGDLESMFTVRKQDTFGTGKIVSIVYNICVSVGISAETMVLRGAICLALVDTLEACGFRCQVTLAAGLSNPGSKPDGDGLFNYFVPLKASDQHLSVDTLAFWLAHPTTFRRVIFGMMEHTISSLNSSYGSPDGILSEHTGDIYLSEAHLAAVNSETAPAFLMETLKKFGVEFES